MSVNKPRAERTQVQLNKPIRSGSSGQQRSFFGGGRKGGGSYAPPPPISSSASPAVAAAPAPLSQSLSTNRSFKKVGNGRGSQSRVNPSSASSEASIAAPTTTFNRVVQNGDQASVPSPGFSDTPALGGARPADVPVPRNAFPSIPKAPSSQPASGSSSSQKPPVPPKGDTSEPFPLQFGTINPGIVNGLQIPARTSSAPPNLDEQIRDQARIESFKPAAVLPIPTVPKQQHQQQTRKDISAAHQPGKAETHLVTQIKRDVKVSAPSAPSINPPKQSALPFTGVPMPLVMHFQPQQPQIPPQFGGPGPQMQPPGLLANSPQMTMAIPVGSAPQVAQQIFIPGIQHHFMQQQAMVHQGQGFHYAPPVIHQLPQQLGNLGLGLNSQFPQQQPSKFTGAHKTTVKITHPETHEELKLDKINDSLKGGVSSGQRSLPNIIPLSQPIPTYTAPSQMNYYPHVQQNSYSPSPHVFPSSVPLTSGQVPTSSQTPTYNYPVSQSGQHLSFMNLSMVNTISAGKHVPNTHLHSISQGVNLGGLPPSTSISATVQGTVKQSVGSREKVETSSLTHPVVIDKLLSMAELPKLVKSVEDAIAYYDRQNEVNPDAPAQQLESDSEPSVRDSFLTTDTNATAASVLSTFRMIPEAISASEVPAGNSVLVQFVNDDRKREHVQELDHSKNNQKEQSKGDLTNFRLPYQVQLFSPSITKDGLVEEPRTILEGTLSESAIGPLKGEEIPAASGLSGLEEETSSDVSSPHAYSLGLASIGASVIEVVPSGATAPFDPMLNETNAEGADTSLSEINTVLDVSVVEDLSKNSEVSNASSRDSDDAKVHPCSTFEESSTLINPDMLLIQDVDNDKKVKPSDISEVDYKLHSSTRIDVGSEEKNRGVNEHNRTIHASLYSGDSTALDSDVPSADDHKNKPEALTTKYDTNNDYVGFTDSGVTSIQTVHISDPSASLIAQNPENKIFYSPSDGMASATSLGQKEKYSVEISKPKIFIGRKKKRKEMLSKADSAVSSDLYNAYKGPVEKHKVDTNLTRVDSSKAGTEIAHLEYPHTNAALSSEDEQNKAELDDWENAAEAPTLKPQTSEYVQSTVGESTQDDDGYDGTTKKKYSRDFLLILSQQFTDLPVGFEIGSDIADALMMSPQGKSPCCSPGRITDQPSGAFNHRLVGNLDENKWMKSPTSFGNGRASRLDVGHGATVNNVRPGQGTRNPRGQSSTQFGGILSGPMQSPASQGGMPRGAPVADRWPRARGLIPSLQTPLQVMHKAEKKYEVGKVTDEEAAKQRQVKAILNKLTPQNFEKLFDQVKEANIDSAITLSGVISQIFDKALMEPTFCEMYADFCFRLAGVLPYFDEDNEKITFKRLLLGKCQEEFERGEREQAEANKFEEGEIKQSKENREEKRLQARRRMLGNIRLIGELYKKKMLTERIMHECITKLLGQYESPDEEDIEALCKLMSTIGEMIDHPKAKEHMDFYFDLMKKLSTHQKLSSRVRFMLRDVIDLRKNKWQQRRKVEGPKKIEEVHRDAVQEKQAQSSRLARGAVINTVPRRGQAVEYGFRGSTSLSLPNSQQVGSLRALPSQVRGFGTQDLRLEGRFQFESRTMTLPLSQKPTDDDYITHGPQGGLAREMSTRVHPSISTNGTSSVEDKVSGVTRDQLSPQHHNIYHESRELKLDHTIERFITSDLPAEQIHGTLDSNQVIVSEPRAYSEEVLQEKTISAIREFYSAKDENEVVLCIKELNAPSCYPSIISLWVTDSFERRDKERDLLSKLIVNLFKSKESLLSLVQLLQGFESALSSLEDAVNDAPRAAEFLGRILAKIVMENVVPLRDVGELLYRGGEERGRLREIGLAAEVLGNILETIRSEKGGTVLNNIRASSNLILKDFLPRHPTKSKLDAFL